MPKRHGKTLLISDYQGEITEAKQSRNECNNRINYQRRWYF